MVAQLYPLGKQALLGASDLSSSNVKIVLLSSSYTYSAAHQFYSDLTGTLGTSSNLASKTLTNGVFDAGDTTVTATSTATAVAFAMYIDTGTTTTSPLIYFNDGVFTITIASGNTTSAVAVDPLAFAVANNSTLTRTSGTGAASITLSGSGGGSAGGRSLTASGSVTTVAGDTYTANIVNSGLPVNINNGQTVNIVFDNGAYKIFAWLG